MKRSCMSLLAAPLLLLGFDHGWCSGSTPPGLRDLTLDGARTPRISRSVSVPGDELWWDGFSLPVTDGSVSAAIEYQGSLVIAGGFTRIGDVRANNIARWDGVAWLPLGSGIEWGYVSSLAIHQGDLIAAGDFWFAGGVLARSIACWNGTEWSGFGQGFHDANTNPRGVLCIASNQDTLVAAVDLSYENYYGDRSAIGLPSFSISASTTI